MEKSQLWPPYSNFRSSFDILSAIIQLFFSISVWKPHWICTTLIKEVYLAFANDIKSVSCGPLSDDVVTFSVVRLCSTEANSLKNAKERIKRKQEEKGQKQSVQNWWILFDGIILPTATERTGNENADGRRVNMNVYTWTLCLYT